MLRKMSTFLVIFFVIKLCALSRLFDESFRFNELKDGISSVPKALILPVQIPSVRSWIPSPPKTFVFNESNSLGTELNPVLNPFATESICLNESYHIVAEVNPELSLVATEHFCLTTTIGLWSAFFLLAKWFSSNENSCVWNILLDMLGTGWLMSESVSRIFSS